MPRPRLIFQSLVLVNPWVLDIVQEQPPQIEQHRDDGSTDAYETEEEFQLSGVEWQVILAELLRADLKHLSRHLVGDQVVVDEAIVDGGPCTCQAVVLVAEAYHKDDKP